MSFLLCPNLLKLLLNIQVIFRIVKNDISFHIWKNVFNGDIISKPWIYQTNSEWATQIFCWFVEHYPKREQIIVYSGDGMELDQKQIQFLQKFTHFFMEFSPKQRVQVFDSLLTVSLDNSLSSSAKIIEVSDNCGKVLRTDNDQKLCSRWIKLIITLLLFIFDSYDMVLKFHQFLPGTEWHCQNLKMF